MIYKHKTQFYTFVLVRTANLSNDLGGVRTFLQPYSGAEGPSGKISLRFGVVVLFCHRCLRSPFLGRATTV